MLLFENEFIVRAGIQDVFDFHADINNLLRISPADTQVEILKADSPLSLGSEVHLRVRDRILNAVWKLVVTRFDPPNHFVDRQISGVFRHWEHEHLFESISESETRVKDIIRYELPFGLIGRVFGRGKAERRLMVMFAHREKMTKQLLESA